jgi:2'-5' RNA ligase
VKIFIGVAAGAPVTAAAGELSRELQARAAAAAPGARISWVPLERFHLTVLFIGHVTPPQFEAVRAALARPFAAPRFDLEVAGAGVFPASGRPRVVWAGCGDGAAAFIRLQREAHRRIAAAVPLEPEREARPHLTLARVKDPDGLRAGAWLAGLEAVTLGTLRIDAVTLFESRPVRNGVEYEPLLQASLAAG